MTNRSSTPFTTYLQRTPVDLGMAMVQDRIQIIDLRNGEKVPRPYYEFKPVEPGMAWPLERSTRYEDLFVTLHPEQPYIQRYEFRRSGSSSVSSASSSSTSSPIIKAKIDNNDLGAFTSDCNFLQPGHRYVIRANEALHEPLGRWWAWGTKDEVLAPEEFGWR